MNQREEMIKIFDTEINIAKSNIEHNSPNKFQEGFNSGHYAATNKLKGSFLKLFPENYQENEFLKWLSGHIEFMKQTVEIGTRNCKDKDSTLMKNKGELYSLELVKKKYLETHKAKEE